MSERKLPVRGDNKNPVQLHDNGLKAGSLIEQSLSRLDHQQANNLLSKAAEEALRLEVKSREQNMDYVLGKKAVEDHIDAFNMLEKRGRSTRQSVTSDVNTGAGKMHIESKSGATCFVASVAYDDPNHPDVMFLRAFRDGYLANLRSGQAFIRWYWSNGPKLAKTVAKSSVLRLISRKVISTTVVLLKLRFS